MSVRANSVELSNMVSGLIADKMPMQQMSSMKKSESMNFDNEPISPAMISIANSSNKIGEAGGSGGGGPAATAAAAARMRRRRSSAGEEPFSPLTAGSATSNTSGKVIRTPPRSRRNSLQLSETNHSQSRNGSINHSQGHILNQGDVAVMDGDISPLPLPRTQKRRSSAASIKSGSAINSRRNSSVRNMDNEDEEDEEEEEEVVSPLPLMNKPRSRRSSSINSEKQISLPLISSDGQDSSDDGATKDNRSVSTGSMVNNPLMQIVRGAENSSATGPTRLSVMLSRSLSMMQRRTMGRSM
jgi:hypothetical protein